MNKSEPQLLLKADDVLCADSVRAPEVLVEVFAVPATELSSTMVDIIKRPQFLENSFDLTKFTYVGAGVQGQCNVRPQRKANLVRLMGEIAGHHVMISYPQFTD